MVKSAFATSAQGPLRWRKDSAMVPNLTTDQIRRIFSSSRLFRYFLICIARSGFPPERAGPHNFQGRRGFVFFLQDGRSEGPTRADQSRAEGKPKNQISN